MNDAPISSKFMTLFICEALHGPGIMGFRACHCGIAVGCSMQYSAVMSMLEILERRLESFKLVARPL